MAQSDNTALMALIGFIVITLLGGVMTFLTYNEIHATTPNAAEEFGLPPGNAEEPGLREQLAMAKDELKEKQKELQAKKRELQELDTTLLEVRRLYLVSKSDLSRHTIDHAWYNTRAEVNETAHTKIEQVRRDVIVEKDARLQRLREEKDQKDQEYNATRRKLQSDIDRSNQQILAERNRAKNREEQVRKNRSRSLTRLNQIKDELEKITRRPLVRSDIEADGKVVRSYLEMKLAVINLGSSVGVKKGFRFEVFQLKGNRRVSKGFIEVKEADAETSSCIIVEWVVKLPRDPVTSYVARQPEEKFSPFVSGGETGTQTQRLSAKAKVTVFGMNKDDPVVPGDLIWNPFFDTQRALHFAVKGDPITYNRSYIVRLIRQYGGTIDQHVTAETDYLVAGKWAGEDIKKARELGVRVFHEFELFRFLAK